MRNSLINVLHKMGPIWSLFDRARDYSELAATKRRKSFSQHGEDLFLRDYFGDRQGFYIEIGGNHPFRLSNTYLLYRMGWSGMIVEPVQRLCALHKRYRPRDIQVNAAVGDTTGDLTFYEMTPSVASTCDPDLAKRLLSSGAGRLVREYTVPVLTVADLYRTNMANRRISLLSTDTEGNDMAVLRGIDWEVMRPEVIICEANNESKGSEINTFLAGQGYECIKVLGCNRIFSVR
jgi:FkbM family methyltransferase